ncbi:MAG: hypothetical protein GY762_20940 [Proteobacteria bacterium]|nr:hypothetical protein [Pseudomonadota bacterium]
MLEPIRCIAPTICRNPVQTPGTDLCVEANQSAKSTVRLVEKLLAAFGNDATDPKVFEMSTAR